MKKTNKIYCLGLIGLSGLLGLYNTYLFTLFSFFILFIFLKEDERIEKNIGLASRNALLTYVLLSTIILLFTAIAKTYDALPVLATLLSQGVLIFGISYIYYNKKGE